MLRVIVALTDSLPRIFDLGLAPVLLLMALSRRTRAFAAFGFAAIAALSTLLLSVASASIVYLCWRFGHVALDLLENLGPAGTLDFLVSLLRVVGVQPVDLVALGATAVGSSIAAVVLSWVGSRRKTRGNSRHDLVSLGSSVSRAS